MTTATSTGPDSSLYSEDLAPVPPAGRKWNTWNYAALWISMSLCIPTYMLAIPAMLRAIACLILGILPNIPGFLVTIGVIGPGALPAWIISLYSYAWFVGFFISGLGYWLSFNDKKQVTYVSVDY